METIRVQYGRKLTQKLGEDFDSTDLGAAWEFDVPDGSDFQAEYSNGLAVIKMVVDQHFDVLMPPKPTSTSRSLPGEKIAERKTEPTRRYEPEPEQQRDTVEVVENVDYEFFNQKVWQVEEGRTPRGKPFVTVRIGHRNSDQIPGTGYARVKSYNPYMIAKLKGLREGDFIDVTGKYEGWDGREGRMYDFVPSNVEMVRDVRSG